MIWTQNRPKRDTQKYSLRFQGQPVFPLYNTVTFRVVSYKPVPYICAHYKIGWNASQTDR